MQGIGKSFLEPLQTLKGDLVQTLLLVCNLVGVILSAGATVPANVIQFSPNGKRLWPFVDFQVVYREAQNIRSLQVTFWLLWSKVELEDNLPSSLSCVGLLSELP